MQFFVCLFVCLFFFFKKMEVGSLELKEGMKRWISRAKMWLEKEGLEGSTSLKHHAI